MIRNLKQRIQRFRNNDAGTSTVEFAIMFPIMLFFFFSGVEMGFITMRHTMLERALDLTVRDVRLATGNIPQHDELKTTICDRAPMIQDCSTNLKLEMILVDPRNWTGIPATADCTDKSEDVQPAREFVHGTDNELMILRACAKFKPVFPAAGLGRELNKDGAGYAALVSTSAFVQEPR